MENIKFQFFMSQLTHVRDVKDTEKTHISVVFHQGRQAYCILRRCKGRDLSGVCDALRKVRHPNTVVVYDFVYAEGDTYILEENLSGTSLEECLSEDRLFSEEETARLMLRLCDGLEPLHSLQPPLVHNDINPSNIMLREDGSIKLFDFDISRLYKQGAGQNTELFGTEEYASPEHYGYGQSEPRTDIYSMGVTMHKMLTGKGLTARHEITYRGRLRPILEKCLRLDPKQRYRDVGALRKELEGSLTGKKRLVFWVSVAAAGLLLLALLLWIWGKRPQTEPEQKPSLQTESTTPSGEAPVEQPENTTPTETEKPAENTPPSGVETTGQTSAVTPSGGETTEPTNGTTPSKDDTTENTEPPVAEADNTTPDGAVEFQVSQDCPVTVQAGVPGYYVFTAEEAGLHVLSLENRSVPCRVFYSGDRGQGSLFSGWADHTKTTTRSFRLQPGDRVCVQIKANDSTASGECVLRVELS